MFKNDFQGGQCLDVFSVQGKDPLSKLKLKGSIRKEFDNEIRTFILVLLGDPSRSCLAFPKNDKQTLHLMQQYVVFQIFVHAGQSFSMEVAVCSQNNMKLRIILSSCNEIIVTTHHVKMPHSVVATNTWLNLCFDLKDLVSEYFDGTVFDRVDSVVVSANSKLRRIFTLKEKPTSGVGIPNSMKLPADVPSIIQVIDTQTYVAANINVRSGTGNPYRRTPHKHSVIADTSHIAFGSRVRSLSKDSNNSCNYENSMNSMHSNQDSSRSSNHTQDIFTSRNRSNSRRSLDLVDLTSQGHSILPSKPSNRQFTNNKTDKNNNSNTDSNNNNQHKFVQPKPPPDKRPPDARRNIRRPRVKSADLSRGTLPAKEKPQTFSKSADSRNRRRPSIHDAEISDEESTIKLPPIQFKRRISRSTFELETMKNKQSELNDLSKVKSKSLTVLPNIGGKNLRYNKTPTLKLSTSSDSQQNKMLPSDDAISSDSNKQNISDNVFTDDETFEELMTLADEHMVDDYLKDRTRSGCRSSLRDDESSTHSGMSTNSELYTYYSTPHSVTGHQQKEPKHFKHDNKETKIHVSTYDENNVNNIDVLPSSSGISASINGDQINNTSRKSLLTQDEKERVYNETFAISKMKKENGNNNETGSGLDLSWEYSESTSMLVIPSDLKKHLAQDDKTELEVSLEVDTEDDIQESEHKVRIDVNNEEKEEEEEEEEVPIQYQRTSSPLVDDDHQKQQEQQSEDIRTPSLQQNAIFVEDNELPLDEDDMPLNNNVKSDDQDCSTGTDVHDDVEEHKIVLNSTVIENNSISDPTPSYSNIYDNSNKENNVLHNSYIMKESCGSDTMSWLHASNDPPSLSAVPVAHNTTLDKLKSSPNMILQQRLKEQLGSMISKDDSGDEGLSDCSDDTVYTDLPQKKFRNYRYQDEIKSIGSTLDLSATIPATPRVGEQARCGEDENNNADGTINGRKTEEYLDLMYDTELNCYYDPVTHKYYELN